MSAFGRGKYILECGSSVTNSGITNSSIDMNGGVITTAGTPVNPTDVANKAYVDATATAVTTTITLTGTAYTVISPLTSGQARISVKNVVPYGPSGSFETTKSESTMGAEYTRLTLSHGLTTGEALDISWPSGSGIKLKKTGVNYDGQYRIKLYIN